jgi:hypothetical protein
MPDMEAVEDADGRREGDSREGAGAELLPREDFQDSLLEPIGMTIL